MFIPFTRLEIISGFSALDTKMLLCLSDGLKVMRLTLSTKSCSRITVAEMR